MTHPLRYSTRNSIPLLLVLIPRSQLSERKHNKASPPAVHLGSHSPEISAPVCSDFLPRYLYTAFRDAPVASHFAPNDLSAN